MTTNITKMMTICAITMGVAMTAQVPAMANDWKDGDKKAHMEMKTDHYMKKIDTNSDGKLSKAEYDAFGDKMFKETDTNNDGMISKDEMITKKKAEHAKMKSEMKK